MPGEPQFVAAVLPPAVLEAMRSIRFRIRAVSNPLVPSMFERSSGAVILYTSPALATAKT